MAEPPEALTETPEQAPGATADAALDLVSALRLSGAVFLDAEFTAPWCIRAQVGPEDCAPFAPVPRHIIAYHCVTEGALVVALDGAEPLRLEAGETVVLPRNDPHTMGSAPGLRPVSPDALIQPGSAGGLARIVHGGGGARTRLVCGYLGCELANPPVVALLPRMLKLAAADAADWTESSFRFAAGQLAAGGGAPAILARLAELLFVEAVRRHLAADPDAAAWTAGLGDPVVRRALGCMHADLAHRWTTGELAARCNLSRSAFAARFARAMGKPPLRYLGARRLERARQLLEETEDSLTRIAYAVGYESEAASTGCRPPPGGATAAPADRMRPPRPAMDSRRDRGYSQPLIAGAAHGGAHSCWGFPWTRRAPTGSTTSSSCPPPTPSTARSRTGRAAPTEG